MDQMFAFAGESLDPVSQKHLLIVPEVGNFAVTSKVTSLVGMFSEASGLIDGIRNATRDVIDTTKWDVSSVDVEVENLVSMFDATLSTELRGNVDRRWGRSCVSGKMRFPS